MSYTEDPTVRHPGPLKGCAIHVLAGDRHTTDCSSLFSSVMDHCSGLHLLQREAPLTGERERAYADIWAGI